MNSSDQEQGSLRSRAIIYMIKNPNANLNKIDKKLLIPEEQSYIFFSTLWLLRESKHITGECKRVK